MNIKTPPNWRKGQTIFNFLEWLGEFKEIEITQGHRMADPFNIPDKELDKLFKEFIKWTNK